MGFPKRLIRTRIVASLAFVAFALTSLVGPSLAQEKLQPAGQALGVGNEPVLVVTVGSIGKLMQDANYISGVVGQPGAGGMFQMMAATFTNGIDTTQPIGVLVPMVNGMPEPIAVIPTADIKSVLQRLEAQTGPVDELGDGTLVIAVNANTVYIRQVGNWAVAGRTRDVLSLAPADPTALFKGMGNSYDLAVRARVQQIPKDTREMLLSQMRQGFEQAMAQQNNADPESAREMAESTFDQLETFINESDTLNFGININPDGRQVEVDFGFTALAGTKLGAVYSGQRSIPSKFASVIREDAASYFHAASSIGPEGVEMARKGMESTLGTVRSALANNDDLSADQQAEIAGFMDRFADLYVDSIAEGKMDMGAMLIANEDDFRFAMGGFVADGDEAARIVKDLAAKVQQETSEPRFKFDQGTHNGVTMHVIEADVPPGKDEARQMFGDPIQVHIGTGPKAVYLSSGKNSEAMLKQLIDSGSADPGAGSRPVSQLRFVLLPILKFAQSIEDSPPVAAMIASLSGAADPGVVEMIGTAIPNGSKSRFTVGEGLIQTLGAAYSQAQGPPPGQF